MDGDLDPLVFHAERTLAGALLLYEEVWFEYNHVDTALTVLGPDTLIELLHAKRIVPFALPHYVSFELRPGQVRGGLTGMFPTSGLLDQLMSHAKRYAPLLAPGHATVAEEIVRHTLLISEVTGPPIIRQTNSDLIKPAIRKSLGLSPHLVEGTEPAWDWPLVNRLVHINTARAVANARRIDVIEYEAAGSRLASEKWYSEVDFHRLFPTSSAFDLALRANGIPDLGLLVDHVGLPACVSISNSPAGRSFRDWFWSSAVDLLTSGADLTTALGKAVSAVDSRADATRLASKLKLAYFQQVGADYIVGAPIARTTPGISSRGDRADDALTRQRRNHAGRRQRMMRELASISAPGRNAACPCGSGAKFKRCCGGS